MKLKAILILLLICSVCNGLELVRQKNVATYITFPIVDVNNLAITSAAGLDSEIDTWGDGSAPDGFADCTNEATEIGATGIYYLSLTQAEMNVDYIFIKVYSSTSGTVDQRILIRTIVGDPLNLATSDDGGTINVTGGAVDTVTTLTGHTAQTGDTYALANGATGFAAIDTVVDTILVDTNELQEDWADGGRLDLIVDSILTDTGTTLEASIDLVAEEVWEDANAVSDANVTAILEDTGTTLPGTLATITADTNELQTDWTDAGRLDALVDAIKAKTDNLPADPADDSDIDAQLADIPTVAEFTARTLAAADYFLFGTDTVANVATVATLTGHTAQTGDTFALANGAAGFVAIDTVVDAILADSNELQTDWTNTGRLDTILDSILTDTAEIGAAGAGLTAVVLAANGLDSVVMADLSAVPGATADIVDAINWLYMMARNKMVTHGGNNELELYNDGGTKVFESDISDDGTSFTRNKWGLDD